MAHPSDHGGGSVRRLILRILLSLPALALPLTLLALGFLVATESGLQLAVNLINRAGNGQLSIESASGTLLRHLQLGNVRVTDGIDTVQIGRLTLAWQPQALLSRRVLIPEIRGDDVRVLLGESSGDEARLPPFSLPVGLEVGSITVHGLTIVDQGEELLTIRQAALKELSLNGTVLRFADLSIIDDTVELHGRGTLQTIDGYPLDWTVDAALRPEGYAPIIGTATFRGPVAELAVQAELRSPSPVHLAGRLEHLLGTGAWQARLTAPEVQLNKVNDQWPEQRFTQVAIEARGSFHTWNTHLRCVADLPEGKGAATLEATIDGDFHGLQVKRLSLTKDHASLKLAGTLAWTPQLAWQAELNGDHLDPALFLGDWPGDLTTSVSVAGEIGEGRLQTTIQLNELGGRLRGFPVSGRGEARFDDRALLIPRLHFKSGASTLEIDGTAANKLDLRIALDSGNLDELWPQGRGRLSIQARLGGQADQPRIEATLTGSGLGIGENGIGRLKAEGRGSFSPEGAFACSLEAEKLQAGTLRLDQARLNLRGSPLSHTLRLEGRGPEQSLDLRLKGAFGDHSWQGTLDNGQLTDHRLGKLQQQGQATMVLNAGRAEMKQPFCLAATQGGRVCLEGAWTAAGGVWQARAKTSSLSLPLLIRGAGQSWPIEGSLDGAIEASGSRAQLITGKGWLDSSGMQAQLQLPDGTIRHYSWKKNKLQFTYDAGRLRAELESEVAEAGGARLLLQFGNLPLPGGDPLRAPMKGSLELQLSDLSPVSAFTEQMIQVGGTLSGRFSLAGSLDEPLIDGSMALSNGRADIPALGITLAPLQLTIRGDRRRLSLFAVADSGQGRLQADALFHPETDAAAAHTLHLTGTDFKAVHLPDLDLNISPDLHLSMNDQQITVQGTVAIPHARLTSIDRYKALTASEDMVVIDRQQPGDSSLAALPLFYTVTVSAGDDVIIDTFGLKGSVSGTLEIRGQPGRPPVGNGTLGVHKATFSMYGKRLSIDLGRLLFSGGPLTNPGVELKSEHKTEKVTTGVQISGFLKRPEITFYSTPVMEQSAIINNLLQSTAIGGETREDTGVIGSTASKIGLGGLVPLFQGMKKLTMIDEIRMETGADNEDLSLVFGSWLTPDFYVSYGKDLLKESGSFNTRYTLGKGFYFSTETGSSGSGGDLFWEYEH